MRAFILPVTVLILLAEVLFSKVEAAVIYRIPEINLYVECMEKAGVDTVLQLLQQEQVKVLTMEVMRATGEGHGNTSVILSVRLPKKCSAETLLLKLNGLAVVASAEEL